jgi:hypothetical protein
MRGGFDPRALKRLGCLAGAWLLIGLGFVAALVFVRWSTLLCLFGVTAGTSVSIHLSLALFDEPWSIRLIGKVFTWAVRVGLAVVPISGYAAAVGAGTTLLIIGLVCAAVACVRISGGKRIAPEGIAKARSELPSDPARLSDEQLCEAWRSSFSELMGARDLKSREAVVELRGRYLDEFGSRYPSEFEQWLLGAWSAASEPSHRFRGS